jgi:hypothetical protein
VNYGTISTNTCPVLQHKGEANMFREIGLNDVVRLKKAHPCGGYEWRVVRLGADIGIKCLTCGRRVLLERSVFERRVKELVARGDG